MCLAIIWFGSKPRATKWEHDCSQNCANAIGIKPGQWIKKKETVGKKHSQQIPKTFFFSSKNACFFKRFKIETFFFQFTDNRGQTLSILSFVPVIDDEGKYLTCRAENPWIPESALEDSFRLTVHCEYLFKSFFFCPRGEISEWLITADSWVCPS